MIDFKQKIEQEERYRYPAEEDLRPNKKTKRLFVYLAVFGILSVFFVGKVLVSSQGSGGNWFTNTFLGGISHLIINPTTELNGEKEDRINILLLGTGGEGHDGGNLTDTIILLSVKPSTKQASMISIPRDMLVPTTGGSWRKVNSINAFAEMKEKGSGGQTVADSLSQLLNQPIPYYVRADFDGFINIVDEVGGVDVYVENTFDDYTYPIRGQEDNPNYNSRFEHLHFDQGWQKMDGLTALKYTRSRHALGKEGSDFARARRQQIVLEGVKEKVLSRNTLTNPATVSKIIGEMESHISTNLKVTEMIKLWSMSKDIQKTQIINRVLDNSVSGLLMDSRGDDGAYILLPRGGNFRPVQDMISSVFGDTVQNNSSGAEISVPEIKEVKIKKIKETSSVEVLNGTWIPGLASKAGGELKDGGFTVTKLGNSPERNYTKNTIYDLSYGEKKESLEALRAAFEAEVSFSWPLWLEQKISTYEGKASSSDATSTSIIIDTKGTSTGPNFILILGDKNNTATVNE
ncbi:MAG: LCP family protein [Candidatus Falkowbacteria bacterium]|nr:LCP family protein [Candidatus Falkowbacteria bacterium]